MPTTLETSSRKASPILEEPAVTREKPRPSIGLLGEIWTPWLLATGGLIATYFYPPIWLMRAPWNERLLDHVIAACSIFVAYLLTAATVLPAVEEKTIIQRLRNWGYYEYILRYIGRAAWACGLLLLLSLAVAPLSHLIGSVEKFDRFFSAVWWSVFGFAIG
jgi:hypothetical protein